MNELLRMALAYRAAGFSVIPLGRDKRPFWSRLPQVVDKRQPGRWRGVWQPYRQRAADEAQLHVWFGDGRANIGLVAGAVSGGLLALDFDHEAKRVFSLWQERVGELVLRLPVVVTRKGFHVYLRAASPGGNRTLAWSADRQKRIETRGEGGYVTAPPSRHPSGHIYRWLGGDQTAVPLLTSEELALVLSAAAHFDQRPRPGRPQPPQAPETAGVIPEGETWQRLQRYALAALQREAADLMQMPAGGRNDALNRAAFCLGRYVGAGLLAQELVVGRLHQACQRNGLIRDDGSRAFWITLMSGLEAGVTQAVLPGELWERMKGS